MTSSPTSSPQGSEPTSPLGVGALVGGRFLIEQHKGGDALGELLLARDQKTNKPIAVRVLAPVFGSNPAVFEAIRNEIRAAAKFKHRSLVGTYGIGTHGRQHFIACEWVQGTPLAELIASRGQGSPLSLRGIYNVVAHVCKALAHVHEASCHGALRPSAIWITKSGRVKLGELGLSLALVNTGSFRLLGPEAQAFLAPEIVAGGQATRASDVFGVGALLYVLLTGRAPVEPLAVPSGVHPDCPPELDAVVHTCLAADPNARFASVGEISLALMPLVSGTPEPEAQDFGVGLEIDVDITTSLAPPAPGRMPAAMTAAAAPRATPPARPMPAPPAPKLATNGNRASPAQPVRVSDLLSGPGQPPKPAPAPPPRRADDEIATLTAKLTERDAPRWMAVKGGLDHGPFTARELIKLIVDGEILSENSLLNMTTNERKPLAEWTEFGPFIEQYKLRKAEADHAVALEKSTRIERGSNAAKFVILSGSIALLLVAGGWYVMSRQAAKKRQAQDVNMAEMFESGQVKISGTAGILKAPGRRSGGGKRSGGSSDGSGFTSYEDAMNQAMELGDATKGGGERQLRPQEIEGVMNRRLNTLFSCVGQELRGGSRLGTVQIDMAILGSGQVAGASVNAGSPAFKKCIATKVKQISFPSFPAPRMGARYSFGVN